MASDDHARTSVTEGLPRPCTCDRFEKGKRFAPGMCVPCFQYWNNPKYRKLWSPVGTEIDLMWFAKNLQGMQESQRATPTPAAKSATPVKCRHLGNVLPPEDAARLGLGTVRQYFPCAVGLTLNVAGIPGYVCGCKGCGPTCPKYLSGGESDEE